jgi:Na+/H+ antiporter NhaC
MDKNLKNPWIFLPIVLSVIFAAFFFPIARKTHELPLALLYTAIGICVIWGTYFVRVFIFERMSCKQENSLKEQ